MGQAKESVQNYDLMSVIMLCLGGPDVDNYDGIIRMLDVLLSDEMSEAAKRQILQDDYNIEMTTTMEKEVSDMCNLSAGVEAKGIAKGLEMGRAEGEAKGRAEGEAKGRAEGVAMGEKKKAVESARNLIKEGLPVELIARALVLPVAEVMALKEQMT